MYDLSSILFYVTGVHAMTSIEMKWDQNCKSTENDAVITNQCSDIISNEGGVILAPNSSIVCARYWL